jgi:hypothetical protein
MSVEAISWALNLAPVPADWSGPGRLRAIRLRHLTLGQEA